MMRLESLRAKRFNEDYSFMKKKILLIIILLAILYGYNIKKQNQVCFENTCFDVELAKSIEKRNNGLSFRESLDSKKGMLFIFNKQGKHSFWMKNTLIPLDIIWIDENKEIVFISENTQPCRQDSCHIIKPTENAKYVLEINAGLSEKIGLFVGDEIIIK